MFSSIGKVFGKINISSVTKVANISSILKAPIITSNIGSSLFGGSSVTGSLLSKLPTSLNTSALTPAQQATLQALLKK